MNWNVNIQATVTNPANYLVAAVYDHSAPTVVVQSIPLPKPYGSSQQIVFAGLEAILYDFKLFESVDTSPAGTIRSSFVFEPTEQTTRVRADLYLTADISTNFTSEATSYTADAPNDLTGWDYSLERVGLGTQQPGVDYAKDTNGFHLLVAGDVFGNQEKWVLHFIPIVAESAIMPAAANLITATRLVTGDTALDNTDMTKVILISGAGTSLTITLPLLSTVADNKLLMFISEGGNHISATLQCAGSDLFKWMGGTNKIILTQEEQLWAFKANGIWNLMNVSDTIRTVGEIVDNYKRVQPGTVFANGALLSRTDYARLWQYVQSLESGVVIAESSWANTSTVNGRTVYVNKGKYSFGDGSTNFRLPLIYAVGNTKYVDGTTRLPGSFEADEVGQFTDDVDIVVGNSFTGAPSPGQDTRAGHGWASPQTLSFSNTLNATKENKQANVGIYALIRI